MSSEDERTDDGARRGAVTYLYALAPATVVLLVGPWLATLGPSGLADSLPLPVRAAGLALVAGGVAVAVWGVHSFATAGQAPSPVGTPDRLVTDGALAYSRNPIYLGTVAGVVGEAIAVGSLVVAAYAAALWLTYHLLVVYREEPALAATFGEAYEDYRASVPRWV